jgi:hypothetical protein
MVIPSCGVPRCRGGVVWSRLLRDGRGLDDSLEKPVGFIEMEFGALCFTQAGAPGVVA